MKQFKFDELRVKMFAEHFSIAELAKVMGQAPDTLRKKLDGLSPFNMDDVYAIIDTLHIEPNHITIYFPRR